MRLYVCHGAAAVSYCDAVLQQTLDGRMVGQQQVGIQVPEGALEAQQLLSLLDGRCDVVCPGDVSGDKDAEKP